MMHHRLGQLGWGGHAGMVSFGGGRFFVVFFCNRLRQCEFQLIFQLTC
jgi:hypothetical protein